MVHLGFRPLFNTDFNAWTKVLPVLSLIPNKIPETLTSFWTVTETGARFMLKKYLFVQNKNKVIKKTYLSYIYSDYRSLKLVINLILYVFLFVCFFYEV